MSWWDRKVYVTEKSSDTTGNRFWDLQISSLNHYSTPSFNTYLVIIKEQHLSFFKDSPAIISVIVQRRT